MLRSIRYEKKNGISRKADRSGRDFFRSGKRSCNILKRSHLPLLHRAVPLCYLKGDVQPGPCLGKFAKRTVVSKVRETFRCYYG